MGRRSRLESVSIPSLGGDRVDLHPSFSLSSLSRSTYLTIFYPYLMLTLVHVSKSSRILKHIMCRIHMLTTMVRVHVCHIGNAYKTNGRNMKAGKRS